MLNSFLNISNSPPRARGSVGACGIMLSALTLALGIASYPLAPASATYIKGYVSQDAVVDCAGPVDSTQGLAPQMVPVQVAPAKAFIRVATVAFRENMATVVDTS